MAIHNNKRVIASTMEQSNVYKPLRHSNPVLASRFLGLDPESDWPQHIWISDGFFFFWQNFAKFRPERYDFDP
jgi:hypothetical protein